MSTQISTISRRQFLQAASMLPVMPATANGSTEINLVNIGDYGLPTTDAVELADYIVNTLKPDLIFTNGDNSYGMRDGRTFAQNNVMYRSYIDSGMFAPSLGNHDKDIDKGQLYSEFFGVPSFYMREISNVMLVSFDSTANDSVQNAWAQEMLQTSTSRWKIVHTHVPPHVSIDTGGWKYMRLPWHEWGADVVIAGHHHVYERIEHASGLFLVNGLGGKSRYGFGKIHTDSVIRFNSDEGCLHITGNHSELTFKFITKKGIIIDTRTITKPVVILPALQALDLF